LEVTAVLFVSLTPHLQYLFTPVNLAKTGLKADATVAYDFQVIRLESVSGGSLGGV
jgi:hypothetical protein